MKRNAYALLILAIIFSILSTACKKDSDPSAEELLIGNWTLNGVDDDGPFVMHLTINSDRTGSTDMYEFVLADFTYQLSNGNIIMDFDDALMFDPDPAVMKYSFTNQDLMIFSLLDETGNSELEMEWNRVK